MEEYTDSGEDKNVFSDDDNDNNYFTISTQKNRTSKNTDSSPLDPKRLAEEISKIEPKHEKEKKKLFESYFKFKENLENGGDNYCFKFNKMYNDLKLDYSVLVSGFGSKVQLIETFINELCTDGPSIHFKGYLPNLSVKDLLFKITFSLFGVDKKITSPIIHCNFIKSIFESGGKDINKIRQTYGGTFEYGIPDHLYIVIHNIDGYSLRNESSQTTLALLATIPQIHMIATVDAIGAQLLWDNRMLSNFNWTTYSMPTYQPYDLELSYEVDTKGGVGNGTNKNLQPSTILTVLKSLTGISTDIFKELLTCLIEKKKKKIEFKILFDICRDNFLVSSELGLKIQLREFIDHKIIIQKDIGDTAFLILPIEISVMEFILSQLESST
ncbi:hypothetical protein RB653_006875 [Dictyostelium firmibasis]|uniref:Origin recognition complex subunit 2 n=1 Tax=Dictyostelium firmibasis TaxID=79012 RepID=A0AAN7TTP8_9MYCE